MTDKDAKRKYIFKKMQINSETSPLHRIFYINTKERR